MVSKFIKNENLENLVYKFETIRSIFKEKHPRTYNVANFMGYFVIYSVAGMTAGAVSGEIVDNLPYFSEAIPKAAEMVSSLRTNSNGEVYELFYGNTD